MRRHGGPRATSRPRAEHASAVAAIVAAGVVVVVAVAGTAMAADSSDTSTCCYTSVPTWLAPYQFLLNVTAEAPAQMASRHWKARVRFPAAYQFTAAQPYSANIGTVQCAVDAALAAAGTDQGYQCSATEAAVFHATFAFTNPLSSNGDPSAMVELLSPIDGTWTACRAATWCDVKAAETASAHPGHIKIGSSYVPTYVIGIVAGIAGCLLIFGVWLCMRSNREQGSKAARSAPEPYLPTAAVSHFERDPRTASALAHFRSPHASAAASPATAGSPAAVFSKAPGRRPTAASHAVMAGGVDTTPPTPLKSSFVTTFTQPLSRQPSDAMVTPGAGMVTATSTLARRPTGTLLSPAAPAAPAATAPPTTATTTTSPPAWSSPCRDSDFMPLTRLPTARDHRGQAAGMPAAGFEGPTSRSTPDAAMLETPAARGAPQTLVGHIMQLHDAVPARAAVPIGAGPLASRPQFAPNGLIMQVQQAQQAHVMRQPLPPGAIRIDTARHGAAAAAQRHEGAVIPATGEPRSLTSPVGTTAVRRPTKHLEHV
ncbi:hypothetical protein CXG81DRAFT_23170 [Caulochytrium protostelioides]|uniref:Uncharacterized protein n=1 Tax=Caulochytrium protostelioides TaxID=1555241 RepID=A0A4P9XF62_9FUNG|nr:hypothetical protein CXG81DRAFT_23170 [Caulochytrium protostelioides]|eukprot:RKP04215.1 hypothetical protein CXG81DRAFT_23170 [Caulochytrium protostelioides]